MTMMMKQGIIIYFHLVEFNSFVLRIPSYDEIINQNEDDDDEEFEKAEEFERKFNFRYQEPDSDFVCFFLIFCSVLILFYS